MGRPSAAAETSFPVFQLCRQLGHSGRFRSALGRPAGFQVRPGLPTLRVARLLGRSCVAAAFTPRNYGAGRAVHEPSRRAGWAGAGNFGSEARPSHEPSRIRSAIRVTRSGAGGAAGGCLRGQAPSRPPARFRCFRAHKLRPVCRRRCNAMHCYSQAQGAGPLQYSSQVNTATHIVLNIRPVSAFWASSAMS